MKKLFSLLSILFAMQQCTAQNNTKIENDYSKITELLGQKNWDEQDCKSISLLIDTIIFKTYHNEWVEIAKNKSNIIDNDSIPLEIIYHGYNGYFNAKLRINSYVESVRFMGLPFSKIVDTLLNEKFVQRDTSNTHFNYLFTSAFHYLSKDQILFLHKKYINNEGANKLIIESSISNIKSSEEFRYWCAKYLNEYGNENITTYNYILNIITRNAIQNKYIFNLTKDILLQERQKISNTPGFAEEKKKSLTLAINDIMEKSSIMFKSE